MIEISKQTINEPNMIWLLWRALNFCLCACVYLFFWFAVLNFSTLLILWMPFDCIKKRVSQSANWNFLFGSGSFFILYHSRIIFLIYLWTFLVFLISQFIFPSTNRFFFNWNANRLIFFYAIICGQRNEFLFRLMN